MKSHDNNDDDDDIVESHLPKWLNPPKEESAPLKEGRGGRPNFSHGTMEDDEAGDRSDWDEDDSDAESRHGADIGRGPFLNTLLGINVVSVLAALGVAAAQVVVMVYSTTLSPEGLAIRCYSIIFCLVVVLVELEWTDAIRSLVILKSWKSRGFLYAFLGLLTLEEQKERGLVEDRIAALYIIVMGWIMVAIGIMYLFMGLFCCEERRDKALSRYMLLQRERTFSS